VVSASPDARDGFVERLIETKGAVLSVGKVRGLLQGRVPEDQMEARARELLDAAILKRLEAGETVVIPAEGLDPGEREQYVRAAAGLKRPRHLILVETARDQVQEEDRPALNELRRRLDAGELGQEGFQTALRLGGGSVGELKRLVFRPAPRDD
jgi:predicted kinase